MDKPTTHVLAVVDRSGSMYEIADDVRGGFNQYIEDLRQAKRESGDAYRVRLTLTLFHTKSEEICTAAKLRDVPKLNEINYRPNGSTALLDAVGNTIVRFRQAVTLGDNDKVLLVIQTDGQENASREFSWEQIRDLIDELDKTGQWATLYLGQGIDAWSQGRSFGASTQVVNTGKSSNATRNTYGGVAVATVAYAAGGKSSEVGATVAATPGIQD